MLILLVFSAQTENNSHSNRRKGVIETTQMSSNTTTKPLFPQALNTSFAYRLSQSHNALFSNLSSSRSSKRQATSKVNYSEDYPDIDYDFEESNNNNNNNLNFNTFNQNPYYEGTLMNGINNDIDGTHHDNELNHNFDADYAYVEDKDGENDNDEKKDATYEDPNAAFDIYKNLILNSNNSSINLSNYHGNKEAPHELPKIVFTPFEILSNSANPEIIIPIKLKINTSNAVINDNFLWNINETLITPETHASIMAQELDLNKNIESNIANQIKDQIQSYKDLLANPNNAIIDQFLVNEKEFHVVLDISANIGEDFYTDKVEWDLLNTDFTPEMFAKSVCQDIGLKPEFETAIAVAVYDEIYKFKRELIENPQQVSQNIDSLPFFNLVNPDDVSKSVVQGIRYDTKKYGEEFSPTVEKLSEWEIEKRETEKERNLRRRKRETLRVVSGVTR